MLYQKGDTLFL